MGRMKKPPNRTKKGKPEPKPTKQFCVRCNQHREMVNSSYGLWCKACGEVAKPKDQPSLSQTVFKHLHCQTCQMTTRHEVEKFYMLNDLITCRICGTQMGGDL